MSTPPTTTPQCAVILTLAHLLQQHSLSYDDEKNLLLDASVKCATKIRHGGNDAEEGEVHMVLTGSPRPTFAETNAWLLEGQTPTTTPRKKSSGDIAAETAAMDIDNDGDSVPAAAEEGAGGAQLLQEYIAECTHGSSTRNANMGDLGGSPTRIGGSVLKLYRERKYSMGDQSAGGGDLAGVESNATKNSSNNNKEEEESSAKGPMVGHAVVNAISQEKGVGLQSSRAKLLQGTIDRPLWDQRRWTDGECLFSELIDRCGLESFESMNVAAAATGGPAPSNGGADAAAGGGSLGTTTGGRRLQKTTNLLAHLITVPATTIMPQLFNTTTTDNVVGEIPGLAEDVIEEIARGILRCLKRKKSPPASKVYLVLPPDGGYVGERDGERRNVVLARLSAAWQKLERYNDMIGAPKLMADAELVFV
ncbi:hypothetical protein ACHAXR_001304, partial [Thalassiosira sp. AJA248-18]